MTIYSQNNVRWIWKKVGTCRNFFGGLVKGREGSGCLVTCFGMLANIRPDIVNNLFIKKGGFVNGCLVVWTKACKILGLKWYGVSKVAKFYPTICEVKTKKGGMHFVIALNKNYIIDPWDGKKKLKTAYRIVEYHNVKGKPAPAKPKTLIGAVNDYKRRYQRNHGRKPTEVLIAIMRAYYKARGYK